MEHGSVESFSAFLFEWYMQKIRRSVHCGYTAAEQDAQRYAKEVYFQSQLNQNMADNVSYSEVSYDSSKEIINFTNSNISNTMPDDVVNANNQPWFITQIIDRGRIRFRAFHNCLDFFTDRCPPSIVAVNKSPK
ncbi:unnamed protein product [Schistosoma margrebowiei]|uniref:Uncharacterized protein n=1 Tax=Schistosoma margrebowiei TaxID=48269 RepID=A0A183M0D8_9TREM|nr:unnamed protein product [Schistosoma margrebowiei]